MHRPLVCAPKLIRMYRSTADDLQWAQNGVVGTVINGEAIPMVQNRNEDAGFTDLELIPLGADKVFIRSVSGLDALVTLKEAAEFF